MVTSKSLQTVMAEHQQDIATAHAPNKCSFLFDVTWRMRYAAMKLKMAPERRGVKRKATSIQEKLSSDHLNSKGNEFLEDRRYSNNLIDILSLAIGEDEEQIISAQNILEKIFVHLLERGDLFVKEQSHDSSDCLEDSEQVYATWLQDRYMDTKKQLLENLHHSVINVKNNALSILMKLVKTETLFPVKPIISGCSFPADFFTEIIKNIVLEQNADHLVVQLQEFLQYTDISFNILKSLVLILKTQPKKKTNGTFLLNTFSLLSKLDIQKVAKKKSDNSLKVNNFTKCSDNEELSLLNYHYIRKLYTVSWTKFLTFKLPTMLYKEVLVILDEDILPYFTKPLLLTDFLTKSYKIGGAVSLLALSGLFTLMQNYNLEYPDFYKKFYALVEPSVFHSQHKTKFFFLADLFLSSTHIPEYLVAAFIKRLSRLSLVAPPAALLVIIPFICNLLIRHPQLKILMDRPDSNEVLEDPYVMTETDPAKCHAMESSLWEIQTLQSHWHPDVAIKAKFVEKTLPKMETDLSNLYSLDSHKLFQKELVRNYKEVPLNYDKPTGLFQRNEDLMKDIWLLE